MAPGCGVPEVTIVPERTVPRRSRALERFREEPPEGLYTTRRTAGLWRPGTRVVFWGASPISDCAADTARCPETEVPGLLEVSD